MYDNSPHGEFQSIRLECKKIPTTDIIFASQCEIQDIPYVVAKVKKMSANKAANKVVSDVIPNKDGNDVSSGERMTKFGEYDLVAMDIPSDARPFICGHHLGRHGYTLYSKTGAELRLQEVQQLITRSICLCISISRVS